MKQLIVAYITSLVSMLAIDSVWLGTMMNRFYKSRMGHLLGDKVAYAPAVIFYLLYAVGVILLVVQPALKQSTSLLHVFLYGALLGLVGYGTYDLTNQATLKNWPTSLTLVDLTWGALLTGIVSVLAVLVARWL